MSTRIEIHIVGLALCFFKDEFWNIVFVCDSVHPLRFTYPGVNGPLSSNLREPDRDLEIKFVSDTFSRVAEPYGGNFWRMFNMAAPYAHGSHKLKIERRRKTTDLAWMKVPAASFDAWKITGNNYFVQELSYVGAPVELLGQVGKESVLEFDIDPQVAMIITDPNDSSYSKSFTFNSGAAILQLDFDNDCYNNCTHNDFVDLYEFVVDMNNGNERRFAAGEVKNSVVAYRQPQVTRQTDSKIASVNYGNCDPIVIDPPPDGP